MNNSNQTSFQTMKMLLAMIVFALPKVIWAKELNDYGKIYVVNIPTTTTTATYIKVYIDALFTTIRQDMYNSGNAMYTVLVPYRDYEFYDPITFQFTYLSNAIDNKQLNIIGLTKDLADVLAVVSTQGTNSNAAWVSYINSNTAKTNMTCNNNPSSANFLTTNSSANYPKFIATQLPHQSFLKIINSITAAPNQTVLNNSINIMGLEFAPPNGNTDFIFDPTPGNHPNFPDDQNSSGAGVYPAIYVSYMKNIYLDNLNINDLWGSGVTINNVINEYTYAYGNTDEVIIQDNLISNVWGKNNGNVPASCGFNIMGIKNGILQHNKVFNDLNVTHQLASGVGICGGCEFNKDVLMFENEVNGYEFSFWIESSSGGISIVNNRSTGTENGLEMSGNISFSTPTSSYLVPRIENNYFSNENLDPGYDFYSAQYAADCQIKFDSRNATNYFTTFKNNEISIDESKFIKYKQNLNSATFDLDLNSDRFSMINYLPYLENNCNQVNVLSTSANNVLPGVIHFSGNIASTLGIDIPGWCIGNTYTGLYRSINSCLQIQNNNSIGAFQINSLSVAGNAPCTSNSSIAGCSKAYDANTNIVGTTCTFNLEYTLYNWNICYGVSEGFIGGIAYHVVSGGTGPYTFDLDGLKIGNGNFNDGTITHLIPGTHTLTIHDNNGCTGSLVFTTNGSAGSITGFDHYFANENVSVWTGVNTNKTFLVSHVLTIDQNTTFTNCTFNIAPDAIIKVANGMTLTLDGCTLKNECGLYWHGLEADGVGTKVIATGSTFKDMKTGIAISNNAQLDAIGNTFINNLYSSISFENMNDPAYNGFVKNGNTFTSDNAMLTNSNPSTQGQVGIKIFNSTNINIGDLNDPLSGNTFSNIFCGIMVRGDANIPTVLSANSSHIGIYNNNFINIRDVEVNSTTFAHPDGEKMDRCYNQSGGGANYKGAAIALLFDYAPASFDAQVDIENTNATTSGPTIGNCDKGVMGLNVSIDAKKLYVLDNLMGIMSIGVGNKRYNINDNIIENVFLGIQLDGYIDLSNVKGNSISVHGNVTYSENTTWFPFAIDIRNFLSTQDLLILQNDISLDGYSGTGIGLLNTGNHVNAYKNNINLTNSYTGPAWTCFATSSLNGIAANNVNGTKLEGNHIDGNPSLLLQQREDMAGILINNSQNQELHCNHLTNTRFGILGVAESLTDNSSVKGNTLYNHVIGMAFRHLSTEGTFGDIGVEGSATVTAVDNNNGFAGSSFAFKVFKFCEASQNYKIYTSPSTLTQSESYSYQASISTYGTCPYGVAQNQGTTVSTYICPAILNIGPIFQIDNTIYSFDEAISIATDTKVYSEYSDIGHWLDTRRLYEQLKSDIDLRNSSSILLDFFSDMENDAIQQLEEADQAITALMESYQTNNEIFIDQLRMYADSNNENIDNTRTQDANESKINSVFLKVQQTGFHSLNTDDSTLISELANQCPFIGGTAVYKARTLYAYYAPASLFDDIKICNYAGQFKNGNSTGIFDEENGFLKTLLPDISKVSLNVNDILVYPNPTQSVLKIRYKSETDSKLVISNILGISVKEIYLAQNVQNIETAIDDLSPGVYMYRQVVGDRTIHTGKLIKY